MHAVSARARFLGLWSEFWIFAGSSDNFSAMAHPGGRPRLEFPLRKIELYGKLGLSFEDMAALLDCALSTVSAYMGDPESEFSKAFKRGQARVSKRLRAVQIKAALAGNTTMLIWVGKNWLGQVDTPSTSVQFNQANLLCDAASPETRAHLLELRKAIYGDGELKEEPKPENIIDIETTTRADDTP
jgi:hypothetical protein